MAYVEADIEAALAADQRQRLTQRAKPRHAPPRPAPKPKAKHSHITLPTIAMEHRRDINLERTHAGAGEARGTERIRSSTLADRMHKGKTLTLAQWQAAGILRNLLLLHVGPSEGVGAYAVQSDADGFTRANSRTTTIAKGIDARANYTLSTRLHGLLHAMCGLEDQRGTPRANEAHLRIAIEFVLRDIGAPTQTSIGRRFTAYAASEKQSSAAGGAFVGMLLDRASIHLGLQHQPEFVEKDARRLASEASIMVA